MGRIPPTKDWLRQGGFIHSVTTTIPTQRKRQAGAGQKGSFTSSAGLNLRLWAPTVLLDPPAESRMTPKDGFKPPPTSSVLQSAQSPTTGKPRGSGRGAYGMEKAARPLTSPLLALPEFSQALTPRKRLHVQDAGCVRRAPPTTNGARQRVPSANQRSGRRAVPPPSPASPTLLVGILGRSGGTH